MHAFYELLEFKNQEIIYRIMENKLVMMYSLTIVWPLPADAIYADKLLFDLSFPPSNFLILHNISFVSSGKSKSRNQGLYYLYLEAISVRNSKVHAASGNSDAASGSFGFQAFTEKDLEFISKFKEEHGADVFRQILHSFCPSIYGHELVKGIGIILIFHLLFNVVKDLNLIHSELTQ